MSDGVQFATYPSLRERVVLITGGASGIGEKLVEAFVAQGSRVVFLDIQEEVGAELVARLSGASHAPAFFRCDLSDSDELKQTLDAVLKRFGAVDVVVNNAGYDVRHATQEVTPELWDTLMAVNLKHQFFVTQACLPGMKAKEHGSVINMSSISWMIPSTGLPVYIAAKAAIVGLTRTLAHELGKDNIRVNAILPGAIQTERQKRLWYSDEYVAEILGRQAIKRLLEPEEVARLALFLAADDSSGITSQSYVIDGGWV